ncbi:hypothetical protein OH77DRAFT_1419482, partial [Trametes cingulata]
MSNLNDPDNMSLSDDDGAPPAPVAGPSRDRAVPLRGQDSAELDVPHALDDVSRTQLHVAIATLPDERVREAFATLIDSVPAVTERVFGMLVAPAPAPVPLVAQPREEVVNVPGPAIYVPVVESPPLQHVPRVIIHRWEMCANCGEEFDVGTPRSPVECYYHPGRLQLTLRHTLHCIPMLLTQRDHRAGRLEVNYDAFVDWDEDVHGEMDTTANRREFPENFTWSCCRRDGTRVGCVRGEHEAGGTGAQGRRKRARLR